MTETHWASARNLLILALLCGFFRLPKGLAQPAGELATRAERLASDGQFLEAAALYERAGRLNPDRPQLMHLAADAYQQGRDYRKAAGCYRVNRDDPHFSTEGLRYARALKQSGRYAEARTAFEQSLNGYEGKQKELYRQVVQREIAGCELALRLEQESSTSPPGFEATRLPAPLNSRGDELAPAPFGADALYFTLRPKPGAGGQFRRSEHAEGAWQAPVAARGLPADLTETFGSGAFPADGSRFYCTRCTTAGSAAEPQNCQLLVLRRSGDNWGKPEPLRAYINLGGFTIAAAAVAQRDGVEYLFFSSDRPEGFGGLDLYVCERPISADDLDFSLPRNLGAGINTTGDETTPFFDTVGQALYFSSQGLVSLGGFDVFRSAWLDGQWSAPENLGLPFNSPADDLWFVPGNTGGGWLSSNRSFGNDKPDTFDHDIYEIVPASSPRLVAGEILDDLGGAPLRDCLVSLLEIKPDGEARLVQVQPSPDGSFRLRLTSGGSWAVEVTKPGYRPARVSLGAPNQTPEGYFVTLFLHKN